MAKVQLYGDYHIHTEFSGDGVATVDEIVRAAVKAGLKEIAITDHGVAYGKKFGVRQKDIPLLCALVEKANKEHPIKVLMGIEANVIGVNGEIDVSEELRTNLDILLAGIHPGVKMSSFKDFFLFMFPNYMAWFFRIWTKGRIRKNTEVMKRVIEKNDVDIWVHPNLFFKLDVVEVAKTCAERGTIIELNRRIAYRPIDWERMKATGAKFVLTSDFHDFDRHAIGVPSRTQEELLNAVDWTPDDFINMTGEFRRGGANLLTKVKEGEYDREEQSQEEERPVKKIKKCKERKRIEKQIRRKRT